MSAIFDNSDFNSRGRPALKTTYTSKSVYEVKKPRSLIDLSEKGDFGVII